MKKIVIKVGTNVLTNEDGSLDEKVMISLVSQIVQIKKKKIDVALISSGAVAFGKRFYSEHCRKECSWVDQSKIAQRQCFASIGQTRLMNTYCNYFLQKGYFCAQVLATREDFRSREHYLNMRDCVNTLLSKQIVPILNENDVVAVNERMFSDNDELAGMTAAMIGADMLIILTNVNGLYDGDPENPNSKVISEVLPNFPIEKVISIKKSSRGRGGMQTKCKVAKKLSKVGIETYIVNGKLPNILLKIFEGQEVGSLFLTEQKVSAIKKWMAVSRGIEKGAIIVNQGAAQAIQKGASILPIGVVAIKGDFIKGDVVSIETESGEKFGVGIMQKDSVSAKQLIGTKRQKPFIRRDFIFIHQE